MSIDRPFKLRARGLVRTYLVGFQMKEPSRGKGDEIQELRDPRFKPKLNRESIIAEGFDAEMQNFLPPNPPDNPGSRR